MDARLQKIINKVVNEHNFVENIQVSDETTSISLSIRVDFVFGLRYVFLLGSYEDLHDIYLERTIFRLIDDQIRKISYDNKCKSHLKDIKNKNIKNIVQHEFKIEPEKKRIKKCRFCGKDNIF